MKVNLSLAGVSPKHDFSFFFSLLLWVVPRTQPRCFSLLLTLNVSDPDFRLSWATYKIEESLLFLPTFQSLRYVHNFRWLPLHKRHRWKRPSSARPPPLLDPEVREKRAYVFSGFNCTKNWADSCLSRKEWDSANCLLFGPRAGGGGLRRAELGPGEQRWRRERRDCGLQHHPQHTCTPLPLAYSLPLQRTHSWVNWSWELARGGNP